MQLAIGRLKLAMVAGDLAIALVADILAALLRFPSGHASLAWAVPDRWPMLVLSVLLWPLALYAQGAYRPLRLKSSRTDSVEVIRAGAAYAVGLLALQAALHAYAVSRLFLLFLFVLLVAITLVSRQVAGRLLAVVRRAGRNSRRMLIVGAGPGGCSLLDHLHAHPELGVRVLGFIDDRDAARLGRLEAPLLGRLKDLPAILSRHVVDEVLVTLPLSTFDRVEQVLDACRREGKNVYLAVRSLETAHGAISHSRLTEVGGVPYLGLICAPDRLPELAAKRATDLVVAGLGLVLLSPLLLAVALWVRLDSSGPALFPQERVGLHGRRFTLYKFRTMVQDAEARLGELMDRNEISGPAFKLRDDPRVTRAGRWLRRLSLDELPQLYNVLKGDMSLVGPRPPLPREVAAYDDWHRRRLSVRPGVTGPWQVTGRSDLPQFDRWVELELDYIDHWSFWLDLKILLRTIPEVLALHGR